MGSVCASHSAVPGSILKSDRWKKSNPQSCSESHPFLNVFSVRKHLMGKIKRSSTANAGQLGLIGVNWNVSILFHQLINCHLLLLSHQDTVFNPKTLKFRQPRLKNIVKPPCQKHLSWYFSPDLSRSPPPRSWHQSGHFVLSSRIHYI